MENLRNRIVVRLVSNKKDYLIWTSKPSYMSHKMFDNDLVVISKNKVTSTLNKHAYMGMCILELSKVLMYEYKISQVGRLFHNKLPWKIREFRP